MPKKKNSTNEPLPFKELKEFAKRYPNVWSYCDDMHEHNGKEGLPAWNKICQLPIAATVSIMTVYGCKGNEAATFPAECAALYAWRKYKEIYNFDRELATLLTSSQVDDFKIPLDVLYALPYPCIWIQVEPHEGFFVWFEDDVETHIMELRLFYLSEKGEKLNFILHLKQGWTISDGINDMIERCKIMSQDKEMEEQRQEFDCESLIQIKDEEAYVRQSTIIISRLLQLILYICAENKDIQENEQQKVITRKPSNKDKPKDAFREIRKWDVGYRIGNVIRKHDNAER